jgi:putative nucleotidyltransferase with HDIG domain
MTDVRTANTRKTRLDAMSYVLVTGLMLTVAVFVYLAVSSIGGQTSATLDDPVTRALLGSLVLTALIYSVGRHVGTRHELRRAHSQLDAARSDSRASFERLAFAHNASEVLTTVGRQQGLPVVLRDATRFFDADVAAVAGDDGIEAYVADEDLSEHDTQTVVMRVALEAVKRSTPMILGTVTAAGGQAIAVPLRVQGELEAVLCMWRSSDPFTPGDLEGLGLLGRIVELAMENGVLLGEVQAQLEGTLGVLEFLVSGKRPDYARHAMAVGELAQQIGARLGMSPVELKDIRVAGLLHDVGMMSLPGELADPDEPLSHEDRLLMREHPPIGAEIARKANLGPDVQAAIRSHHERFNGTGYPSRLMGDDIPLAGRILAACEVFDSMTHRAYHGERTTIQDAIVELRENSGICYDPRVVVELLSLIDQRRGCFPSGSLDPTPAMMAAVVAEAAGIVASETD